MILRPAELVPGLAGLPLYEVCIAATILLGHQGLLRHFTPGSLTRQPVTLCFVGVLIAIPVSQITHMYFGGALSGTIEFIKAGMLFALIVAVVDTWSKFERLLTVIAGCATMTVLLCVVDYLGVWDFQFIKHAAESYGTSSSGYDIRIQRMNGTGIFSDPNDISLLIVATGSLCVSFLTDKERGPTRFGWLIPLAILVTGLACTKSRGGMLAACSAGGILVMFRYGKKAAIGLGLLGLIALPILAGRQANIDLSDGTGHQRITLWRDGLAALRSMDLLFGTGHRSYADLAGLVAHNSFIHAYVELGIVGGTFFFGMFFFSVLGLFRLNTPEWQIQHPKQARFLPYMAAMGAGWTVGLMSLSRCYTVSTLMLLGLGAAYLNLAGWNLRPRRLVIEWDRPHVQKLLVWSACFFVALNIFVRVFA
ncbi:MAG: O-antigen ligase domain-containing protein [Planctomycetota bacterium]|nr:O-antigen ligase domain-containing protein [Planctomycetota bacterium]